jgi:SAM-dependent methyltransferase
MSIPTPWHEDDAFWEAIAPFDFDKERWERAPGEVDRILALMKPPAGARVLDLCCGPGRHSLELARRGFRVTGVDRTAGFLEEAGRRARAEGLEVEWVREDMRRFVRPETFDGVINIFTSFAYFDDRVEDRLVLYNAWRSLKESGVFVVDTMAKEVVAREFRERTWSESGGTVLLEERKIVRDWTAIESRWVILQGGARKEVRFTLRLYSAAEMSSTLRDVGFREVQVFGDLSGAPFDHQARRLVAVARR